VKRKVIDKQFASFIHIFVKQYKTDVFNNISKCKSLLLDHAKGEYKNEVRLLLQALDIGCYTTIINSNDLHLTRIALIKQLQEEYFISENIATSLIDLLLAELRNYKTEQKKQTIKTKPKVVSSNRLNTSNQNQPIQLPISNTNNIPIDTSTILKLSSEINSLISTKESKEKLSIERFNDKVKSVYEPAFKEYQEILKEINLNCEIFYSTDIRFMFSFVTDKNRFSNFVFKAPQYSISRSWRDYDTVEIIVYDFIDQHESNSRKGLKKYNIEDLTKKIIINDLSKITKDLLSLIKTKIDSTIVPQSSPKQVLPKQKSIKNNSEDKNDSFSSRVKDLFYYIDILLDYVSEEEIKKFAFSEHYDTYKKIFKESKKLSASQKTQIKDLFSRIDELLEFLPDEKIEEFAQTEYYETYKELFKNLGII